MKYVFAALFLLGFLSLWLAQATLTRPADGKTHLRWATDPNPSRTLQSEVFTQLYPTLAIHPESGAMEKLIVQCATGTGPDILTTYNEMEMAGLHKAGLLLDLTPYAKQYGFSPENTYPELAERLSLEGRQYAFPFNVNTACVIYNKALFEAHGIPFPNENWSYEDFISIAARFNEPDAQGRTHMPLANWHGPQLVLNLIAGQGGRFYSEDGLHSALASPPMAGALQFYHDLIYRHKVIPTPAEMSSMSSQGGFGSGGINWFSNERAAMIFIGRWYLLMVRNYPGMAEKLGVVRLPHFPSQPSAGYLQARCASINSQTPHREAALQFMQYLTSVPYNKMIIEDGDALPPNPALATDGSALVNPTVTDPAFHQVFLDAVKTGRTLDVSPFIDSTMVYRWLCERVARVENNAVLDVQAVMQEFAKEVDDRIRRNLERSKDLQEQYEQITGQPYQRDWK